MLLYFLTEGGRSSMRFMECVLRFTSRHLADDKRLLSLLMTRMSTSCLLNGAPLNWIHSNRSLYGGGGGIRCLAFTC